MLQGLLQRHGIPIPNEAGGFGPTASISMLDVPGGQQRLQVTMPETTPDYFAAFDTSRSSLPVQIHPPTASQKSLPPLPPSAPRQPVPHPYGLDAPQVGIDFVLALENPCLHHTSKDLQSAETYGHILTTHAPLLTHRPRAPQPSSSWTIPAAEIERLLNLSSQLNLAGELTPVQAWSRIRSYPGFEKLNLDQLETLEKALLKEVQCYGYVDIGQCQETIADLYA